MPTAEEKQVDGLLYPCSLMHAAARRLLTVDSISFVFRRHAVSYRMSLVYLDLIGEYPTKTSGMWIIN